MKKILAILLVLCLVIGTVACSYDQDKELPNKENNGDKGPNTTISKNDGNSDATIPSNGENEEPIIEKLPTAAPAKYESDLLKVFEGTYYEVFQGHIKYAQLAYLNDEVIYAEDTIFTRTVDDAIWRRWKVGEDKNILTYDTGMFLVENADGSVTEYRYTNINDVTGEMTTSTEELNVAMDEILYAACAGGEYYVLKKDGVVYYQLKGVSIAPEEGEEDPKPFFGQIGAREPMAIEDFFVLSDYEQVVVIENTVYKFSRSDVKFEDGKAILSLTDVELKNVEKIIDINSAYAFIIEKDDNQYVWAYSMLGFENKKEAKIAVPEGYTASDIVRFIHAPNDILIFEFSDGQYFEMSRENFDDEDLETVHTMTLSENINTIVNNEHFVNIYGDSSYVYVLMDDGYLYTLKS